MGKINSIEGGGKISLPFALAMENKTQDSRLLLSVVLCFLFVHIYIIYIVYTVYTFRMQECSIYAVLIGFKKDIFFVKKHLFNPTLQVIHHFLYLRLYALSYSLKLS